MNLENLFNLFVTHYYEIFTSVLNRNFYNPNKMMTVTKRSLAGVPISYLMMMPACLPDGTVIAKSIFVEDGEARSRGHIDIFRTDGATQTVDAIPVTLLRSSMMAMLAIFFGGRTAPIRLGLIGTGQMNQSAAKVIAKLLKVRSLVIRGSAQNRGKNQQMFSSILAPIVVDDTEEGDLLRLCDVVISCTSNSDPAQALPYSCIANVPLIIIQDGNAGGICFDQWPDRFYVDHPEQSLDHWRDEFGTEEAPTLLNLYDLGQCVGPAVISLYGVAYFDALVARFMHESPAEFWTMPYPLERSSLEKQNHQS